MASLAPQDCRQPFVEFVFAGDEKYAVRMGDFNDTGKLFFCQFAAECQGHIVLSMRHRVVSIQKQQQIGAILFGKTFTNGNFMLVAVSDTFEDCSYYTQVIKACVTA